MDGRQQVRELGGVKAAVGVEEYQHLRVPLLSGLHPRCAGEAIARARLANHNGSGLPGYVRRAVCGAVVHDDYQVRCA